MLNDQEIGLVCRLIQGGEGRSVALHRLDLLGALLPRPERLLQWVEDHYQVRDVDPLGAPTAPRAVVAPTATGWGFSPIDLSGQAEVRPDLFFVAEPGRVAAYPADNLGQPHSAPDFFLLDPDSDEGSLFYTLDARGRPATRPTYGVWDDARFGGVSVFAYDGAGQVVPRPVLVAVWR